MRAKDIIPASKPRNFVAKNQKTAGAGAHKDKKKAEKQGDFKHKKEKVPMEGRHGYDDYGYSLAPGHDEGEPVYSRAHDRAGNYGGSAPSGYSSSSYGSRDKKPTMLGMYFYDVPPGKEDLASIYGIKKTKSGKWAKIKYDSSGRTFSYQKQGADKEFGPGKWWAPK